MTTSTASSQAPTLFDPFDLAGLRLPNRVVMAPMSRVRSDATGLASASTATYYAQRATAGLLITGGIQPSLQGQGNPFTEGLHTEDQTESWKPVTAAVHANGGRIAAQLMHAGRIGHPDTTGLQPVGPSAIAARGAMVFTPTGPQPAPVPRELSTREAQQETLVYAAAARRAVEAGFDAVELHGANGYLIGQFLSSSANVRSDRYGGSIANRIRFAVEAVAATVDAIGGHRVGIRLSPGAGLWDAIDEDVPELYGSLVAELEKLDLAYIHLSNGADDEEIMLGLRRAWSGALILNPTVPFGAEPTDRKRADHWLDLGADLIAFGRPFLANPDLVERLRTDLPLAEADPETYFSGGDAGYITYPSYQH